MFTILKKMYSNIFCFRETIPEEEQNEIFSDVHTELRHLEIQKIILKRKHMLQRSKPTS